MHNSNNGSDAADCSESSFAIVLFSISLDQPLVLLYELLADFKCKRTKVFLKLVYDLLKSFYQLFGVNVVHYLQIHLQY